MSVFNRRNAFIGWLVITLGQAGREAEGSGSCAQGRHEEGRRGRSLDRSRGRRGGRAHVLAQAPLGRHARRQLSPGHRRRRRGSRRLRSRDLPGA